MSEISSLLGSAAMLLPTAKRTIEGDAFLPDDLFAAADTDALFAETVLSLDEAAIPVDPDTGTDLDFSDPAGTETVQADAAPQIELEGKASVGGENPAPLPARAPAPSETDETQDAPLVSRVAFPIRAGDDVAGSLPAPVRPIAPSRDMSRDTPDAAPIEQAVPLRGPTTPDKLQASNSAQDRNASHGVPASANRAQARPIDLPTGSAPADIQTDKPAERAIRHGPAEPGRTETVPAWGREAIPPKAAAATGAPPITPVTFVNQAEGPAQSPRAYSRHEFSDIAPAQPKHFMTSSATPLRTEATPPAAAAFGLLTQQFAQSRTADAIVADEIILAATDTVSRQIPSVANAVPGAPLPVSTAPMVGHLIAEVMRHVADPGTAEFTVRLDPEELGQLRINLVHRDGALFVTVTADRSETLDLMRRHEDDLMSSFSDSSESEVFLEFADRQRDDEAPSDEEPMLGVTQAMPSAVTEHSVIRLSGDSGMDIRL